MFSEAHLEAVEVANAVKGVRRVSTESKCCALTVQRTVTGPCVGIPLFPPLLESRVARTVGRRPLQLCGGPDAVVGTSV